MDGKPRDSQWETTRDVLDWYKAYLEEHEPYAVNAIRSLDDVLLGLPNSSDELGEED